MVLPTLSGRDVDFCFLPLAVSATHQGEHSAFKGP